MRQRWTLPRHLFLTFLMLVVCIAIGAELFYQHFVSIAKSKVAATLETVVKQQADQIALWRYRWTGALEFVARTPFPGEIRRYLREPENRALQQEIAAWVEALREGRGVKALALLDPQGNPIYPADLTAGGLHFPSAAELEQGRRSPKPFFTEIHESPAGDGLEMELIAPLRPGGGRQGEPVAFLIFWMNPRRQIFPIIENWPIPSATGKSFLMRRVGDHLILVGRPVADGIRTDSIPEAVWKRAVTKSTPPSGLSVFPARDNEGEGALASVLRIPETDWYLVAKIDEREAYADVRWFTVAVVIGVALLVLLAGAVISLLWRQQRLEEMSRAYEREREQVALIEASPDIIALLDPAHRLVWFNRVGLEFFGSDAIGHRPVEFLEEAEARTQFEAVVSALFQGKCRGARLEFWRRGAGGQRRHFAWNARAIENQSGQVTHVIAISRDITESTLMEQALKESEEKYRTLVDESLVGVYVIQDGLFRYVNPKLAEIFGYAPAELIDKKGPMELTHPEDRSRVEEHIRARLQGKTTSIHYSFHGMRRDGSPVESEAFGTRTLFRGQPAIQGTLLDITERKTLQAQLVQAQKMESLGTLAGGIAHDFNNMLTGILGFNELALMRLVPEDPIYAHLGRVRTLGERAMELIKKILLFSRKQKPEMQELNLSQTVKEYVPFLRRMVEENVEIEVACDDALPPILADPLQLHQVLTNLCVNARDAMPQGGLLRIETSYVDIDALYCYRYPEAREGRSVLLTVSDTGSGIDEGIQKRIFEPFFTTKEAGKGTGLGLSVCFGIVREHGGWINVYSRKGVGTTFKIYLPAAQPDAVPPALSAPENAVARGAGQCVLVVDDEAQLCDLAQAVLQQLGYRVMTADNGKTALALYAQHRDEVALVMTDMIMPKMGGLQLAQQIREVNPQVPILMCSGYNLTTESARMELRGKIDFLSKPYSPGQLGRKIHALLEAP